MLAPRLAPVAAAAWLVWLASRCRVAIVGGSIPPLTSRELLDWMAFWRLEPWGAEIESWRAGMIAATIANANRDPKRQRKPFEPSDFMPRFDGLDEPEQSLEDHEAILRMWQRALEARDG